MREEDFFLQLHDEFEQGRRKAAMHAQLFYSLIIHSVVLSFLLTLPVYREGADKRSLGSYFVSLTNEKGEKTAVKSPLPKIIKTKDTVKGFKGGDAVVKTAAFKDENIGDIKREKRSSSRENMSARGSESKGAITVKNPIPIGKKPDIYVAEVSSDSGRPLKKAQPAPQPVFEEKAFEEPPAVLDPPLQEGAASVPEREADEAKTAEAKESPLAASLASEAVSESAVKAESPIKMAKKIDEINAPETKRQETEPPGNIYASTEVRQEKTSSFQAIKDAPVSPPEIISKANEGGPNSKRMQNRAAEAKPREKEKTRIKEEKPSLGIPVSDALLAKDIRIEVIGEGLGTPDISLRLLKRAYPKANGKGSREKPIPVNIEEEKGEIRVGDIKTKKIISVASAEKGVYTLIIENKETKPYAVDIIFRLNDPEKKEKIKRYDVVQLAGESAVKFRFIMPDMIFWDDEDRFSGVIEDADSITKFNYESGLAWREEKEN